MIIRILTNELINTYIEKASNILEECVPNYKRPNFLIIQVTKAKSYWAQVRELPGGYGLRISNIFQEIPSQDLFEERFISCMLHELIHTQKGCMNHLIPFKRMAAKVNKKYPQYNISTKADPYDYGVSQQQLKAKWIVICTGCGTKSYYQRRPKYFNDINQHMYCSKCNQSRFEVEHII